MKNFFLLVLLLITGCEAQREKKRCNNWEKIICIPNKRGIYHMPEETNSRSRTLQKNLEVIINDDDDTKTLMCEKGSTLSSGSNEDEFDIEKGCLTPYRQTAYRTAKTTIRCDHKDKSRTMFYCKENKLICKDFTTTSSQKSQTFTLTDTGSGLNLSISNVSLHHAGLYWCGVKQSNTYYVSATQLKVEVRITNFTKSPAVGENLTYYCKYDRFNPPIFICKGEDPSICQHLVSTTKPDLSTRFSMKVDQAKTNITITVREVTAADSGTYWCGAESIDEQRSNTFIHRMTLNVENSISTPAPADRTTVNTSPTSPAPSDNSISTATPADGTTGGFGIVHFLIVGAVLLMLPFVTAFIIFCKRLPLSNNKGNRVTAQHPREDYVYEEIHQNLPKPEPQNAATTIYTTAKMPSEPDSLHYSTINFGNSSTDAEAVVLRPSSSSCIYSTLKPATVQPARL